MAKGNFDPCFQFTVGEEGQYSTDQNDSGNWSSGEVGQGEFIGTCWGISAPTLLNWVGADNTATVTADYMKSLSIDTAKAIYQQNYWAIVHGDDLPAGLDLAVWDFGVNAGPTRSVEQLQQVLGVSADGIIGPKTLNAMNNWGVTALINSLISAHESYYRGLGQFPRYGRSWDARQERLRTAALNMVGS